MILSFTEQINRLLRLHEYIKRRATGTAEQLAKKTDASRAAIYRYMNILKSMGAVIKYSRDQQSYYYQGEFELDFNKML